MQLSTYKESLTDFRASVRAALAPRPKQQVYEWMEENCYVRGEYEGKYNTILTPYVREPLQVFADKRIEDLSLCFATQTAKTTIVIGGVAYRVVMEPGEFLWVMPDKDFGGSFSRRRWQPFVEDCGPLAALRPQDPGERRKFFTTHEQQFGRAVLYFVGSNSATQVAGRSCAMVIMDETDKFGVRNDREAGALQNAEERTKTFNYPLIVKTSTPTTEFGEIWQNFLLGDQRYFWVPCPRCGNYIKFEWPQVRWWRKHEDEARTGTEWDMAKVRENTYYQCQECGGEIKDHQKTLMVRAGDWKPSVLTNDPKRRSYHLNSLYAPWKKTQWANLAVSFLESSNNFDRRQKFINSTLAEPWSLEKGFDHQREPTMEYLVADIQRDRTPILTVDVQEGTSHFWAVLRMWAENAESWLVHAGRMEGFVEIEELAGKYAVDPNNVIFDIAYMTNTVCQWLVERDWRGAWGSDSKKFAHRLTSGSVVERIVSVPKMRDPWMGSPKQSETNPRAIYVNWSRDGVKDQLAMLRYSEPSMWHVHGDAPEEYFKHLNSHQKIMMQSRKSGRMESRWRQFGKEDHLLDCECMQIVGAMQSGIIQEDFEKFRGNQMLLKIQDIPIG